MPWCDTDAMAAHLIEISAAVDPGAHAVLIVDQAGWHLTPKLAIPDNITVLALPPRSPELNPVENVWQFMRDNWLSNRIFKSYEDIVALCCQAWNNLIDQPWKIMSLGMRKWGAWVLINDRWYNLSPPFSRTRDQLAPARAHRGAAIQSGSRALGERGARRHRQYHQTSVRRPCRRALPRAGRPDPDRPAPCRGGTPERQRARYPPGPSRAVDSPDPARPGHQRGGDRVGGSDHLPPRSAPYHRRSVEPDQRRDLAGAPRRGRRPVRRDRSAARATPWNGAASTKARPRRKPR